MGAGRIERLGLIGATAALAVGCLTTDLQPSGSPAIPPSAPTASASATAKPAPGSGALASPTPAPTASPEPDATQVPPHDDRFTPIDELEIRDGGRGIHLAFTGWRPFEANNPCTARYAAATADVDGVLHIGLREIRPPGPRNCDTVGFGRTLDVDLDAPFRGAAWLDRYGPTLHFLSTPPGLAEIDVPDGWRLVAESDEGNGPNGRWSRTYAPFAGATVEQTLQIFQAFDAPADVTGGTESLTVEVAGQSSVLYRFPPTGELVLVYEFDGDGLALVADEQMFSIAELVAIAESARAP